MLNFLNRLFPGFSSPANKRAIGAELNTEDRRDIALASFTIARTPLTKYITDISMLPVQDQQDIPSCVGQAEGGLVEYYIYKTTGKIVNISRRFVYAACKFLDGNPSQGTQPRIGAMVVTNKYGAATAEIVPDNNFLGYSDYINVKLIGTILDDAAKNKLPGFAFLTGEVNQLCQAIEDHGMVTATLPVDFNKWYVALIAKFFHIDGYHRVELYGHELVNGQRKIYFRNSWGTSWGNTGNGQFWFDDYAGEIYDIVVYTDIPAGLLEKARATNFQFDPAQPLKYGDSGYLVFKMQQRLQAAGYLKNVDIGALEPYFGDMTAAALLSFQLDNHIDSVAALQNLRGRQFGPKTIAFMNAQTSPTPKKNMIVAWAQAIQAFEGWAPGSHSYRNNNPGNLRYSVLETGNDGFSIFPDYATGFKALTNLLTAAATGNSNVYNPQMTLLQFYQKYAPSSDNNSPLNYATFVAKKIGVTADTVIGTFV